MNDQDKFWKRMEKFIEDSESSEESTSKFIIPFSLERVSQHLFVSALLALQVLVTGSLPGAMLTQVSMHFHVNHDLPNLRELTRCCCD